MGRPTNQEKNHRRVTDLIVNTLANKDLGDLPIDSLIKLAVSLANKPGGHNGENNLIDVVIGELERRNLQEAEADLLLNAMTILMTKNVPPAKTDEEMTLEELVKRADKNQQWRRRDKKQ